MKSMSLILALIALTIGSQARAATSDDMIVIGSDGTAEVAMQTTDGQQVLGKIVRLTQRPDGIVDVWEPVFSRGPGLGWMPIWSIRLSYPQILSTSVGVLIGYSEQRTSVGFGDVEGGVLLQVEPGLTGGKISVGVGEGAVATGEHWWSPPIPYFGVDLKASLLKSWGIAGLTDSDHALYAGGEADLNVAMIKLSLGILKKISRTANGHRWLVTAGLGLGM